MGFLNERIQVGMDIYNIDTKDLLLDAPVPLLSGYKSMMINAGKTNNKGIEVTVTTHNIQNKDFSWSTTLNLSHNKNKVKALYNTNYMELMSNWAQTSEFNKSDYMIRVGEPLGQMYGYRLIGTMQQIKNTSSKKVSLTIRTIIQNQDIGNLKTPTTAV